MVVSKVAKMTKLTVKSDGIEVEYDLTDMDETHFSISSYDPNDNFSMGFPIDKLDALIEILGIFSKNLVDMKKVISIDSNVSSST